MWKAFLAGVGAIAVLMGGSIAVIVAVTGEERPRAAASGPGGAAAADAAAEPGGALPSLPPPPGSLTYGSAPVPVAAPPPAASQRPPAPPPGSWEAVPVTARAKSLGRLGGALSARLTELHDELATCFTYEAQAQRGAGAVTTVRDVAPMDDTGGIVLMLQLESQAGSIRIVDAPVETRGPAGDELLACAQNVLRGRVLEVPGAVPGKKYRLVYQLIP